MASEQGLWFRIGYALERAKHGTPRPPAEGLQAPAERRRRAEPRAARREPGEAVANDEWISAVGAVLATKLLEAWRPQRHVGVASLLRAGAAGAGAALLVDLLRPALARTPAADAPARASSSPIVTGLAQGLAYASVLEPRLPGPPLLKGALFGTAEYLAAPSGGIARVVGVHTALGRFPGVKDWVGDTAPRGRGYLEHVTFGIALALLYGSNPLSSGILPPEDDDEAD